MSQNKRNYKASFILDNRGKEDSVETIIEGVKKEIAAVQGEVTAIDAAAKRVKLADGSTLAYDRLVVSPGVDFMTEAVGGLAAPAAQARFLHSWKAGAQTVALRQQIEAMKDGGVFAISIPKVPYRCPPGPYERACVVASYLQAAKPKSKVLVLDANPEIQSKKALFEKAFKDRYGGILEYRPNAELKEVDAATSTAKLEFEDVKADVINVIPPQRAADLAKNAGLVNVNNRWVGVNWLTMESTAVPGVHVQPQMVAQRRGALERRGARVVDQFAQSPRRIDPLGERSLERGAILSKREPSRTRMTAPAHRSGGTLQRMIMSHVDAEKRRGRHVTVDALRTRVAVMGRRIEHLGAMAASAQRVPFGAQRSRVRVVTVAAANTRALHAAHQERAAVKNQFILSAC